MLDIEQGAGGYLRRLRPGGAEPGLPRKSQDINLTGDRGRPISLEGDHDAEISMGFF